MSGEINTQGRESILKLSDSLVKTVRELLPAAKTEEELRIGFEKALAPILNSIGVACEPRYERLGANAKTIFRGRPDAVHGQLIIEYERPGAFSSESAVDHAEDQFVGYMRAEAKGQPGDPIQAVNRLMGTGFDGRSIFFLQHSREKPTMARSTFARRGPHPFGPESARTFLTYLRALARLPLTAENLVSRFGPRSRIARMSVSALADALENWESQKVQVLFEEWKRLFGIVYGERFGSRRTDQAGELSERYGVGKATDFQELLFCIHTYFAFLMKLIAAELITMKENGISSSLSHQLAHLSRDDLLPQLSYIEDGGVYAKRGISNFLEGDFFRWYLDAFSPRLEEAVRETVRGLSEFEPATSSIDPESTRDLLKNLYQNLVPQLVRRNLGEYYTPDWLAEFVLNEVRYDGNTSKRLLDPACGSGTFLVLAVQRARQYGRKHRERRLTTAKRIISNIWGFDLNPLTIIAARTNYLFALGDLADELPRLEIPVYLADSVLWPERSGQSMLNFAGGEHATVHTSIGDFDVPAIWIKDKGFLMGRAARLVEDMAKEGYTVSQAMTRFGKEGLVFPPHEKIVSNFYKHVLGLEREGRNGIWARFLKNAFAPMVSGGFDFVAGNPPWVRWGYLSEEYRSATLPMWKEYGLFSLKGHAARLGGGEKDFSMLFTYAAADYYLKKGGKLGFLITQEVFKSKGAGEGFRRFQLGERDVLKVTKAHDLVSVQPFEGATNKTAAIVVKKGQETKYPVPYTVWNRKKGVGSVPTDIELKEALRLLQKTKLLAQPIGSLTSSWQTVSAKQKKLACVHGGNAYRARLGARIEPYGVFCLEVLQVFANGDLFVCNLTKGRRRVRVQQVKERIEPHLVFPAVRGSDIERWNARPGIFVLMSQDPMKSEPYPEEQMKKEWPRTFGYLARFKGVLLSRGSKTVRQLAERTAFYAMFGIGPYTVARYKVVWKRMASDLVAAVVSQHKTPFGYKTVIPTDTTSLIACDNEAEAHYLCAILNSAPVREYVKTYSSAGRGFGSPSAMKHVGIPKFDAEKGLHKMLAKVSKDLHRLKRKSESGEIAKLEKRNDELVAGLFGLKRR